MAIDFPASPTLNQTFSVGNTNYVWDGTKWTASVTGGIALDKIQEGNTSAEVVDTGSDGRFVVTTEGSENLVVASNGDVTITDKIIHSGDTNTAIRFPAADTVSVETNGSERARIDSSGRLLVGTTSSSKLRTIIAQGNSGNANDGGALQLSTGLATPANGDTLGYLMFADSSHDQGAQILGQRDGGTWSASSKPSRLVFSTAADGSASSTERLRIANNGAIGLSGANYGTSGQVLTSQGSGAAPQWATPAGGAWQFISSVTANNSASVAFTSGINSTYDIYVFTYANLESSVSQTNLEMRFSTNGGSSYFSGVSDYFYSLSRNATGINISSGNSGIRISNNVRTSVDNTPYSGFVYLHNASVSGKHTGVFYFGSELDTPGDTHGAGRSNSMGTGVVNAVQFLMTSGNISTGTFRLYGIKNS